MSNPLKLLCIKNCYIVVFTCSSKLLRADNNFIKLFYSNQTLDCLYICRWQLSTVYQWRSCCSVVVVVAVVATVIVVVAVLVVTRSSGSSISGSSNSNSNTKCLLSSVQKYNKIRILYIKHVALYSWQSSKYMYIKSQGKTVKTLNIC